MVKTFTIPSRRDEANPPIGGWRDFNERAYFGGDTRIATDDGHRAARDIRVGDRIPTMDNGVQTVRHVAGRHISAAELRADPRLAPVRIAAGALGNGLPERDLLVSPQHCMMLRSAQAELLCDSSEVLVPAQKLLGLPGVKKVVPAEGIEYVHFLFNRHELVFAEGAVSESLHPDDVAGEIVVPDAARMPDLADGASVLPGPGRATPPARTIPEDAVQHVLVREMTLSRCAGRALWQKARASGAEVLPLRAGSAAITFH